jgi:predicted O-linked N-acetylglucosamine transferase (SPINDLY family)
MPTITHYLGGDHESADAQAHYTEQLVRLPWCGSAQRPPPPARRTWTRAELGIPDDAIVLANFGHALKHGPARDALYAEILARVPRAHLLVKPFFSAEDYDPALVARLHALGRVTIAPRLPRPEDLPSLYSLVDIQLDTFPFGGWTTNLDSLWAGVPIVTQAGETCRSRWGSRFLEVCGVEIGRTTSDREYIEAAVRLAQDDALRRQVGSQIRGSSARFFDGPAAQPLYERALLDMIQDAGRDGGLVT